MSKLTFYQNWPAVIELINELPNIQVIKEDGSIENKEKVLAIFRCGKSADKLFCDGSHKE